MHSKSSLAIALSRLSGFSTPDIKLEQYTSDPEIAAELLWNAYMLGDIETKTVADFGCGPGMLGIGAALLRAKSLVFVDSDKYALQTASMHYAKLELEQEMPHAVFEHMDIKEFSGKADTVIMNPPFGTRLKHTDTVFLEKAFSTAKTVISFHKTSTIDYIKRFSFKRDYGLTHQWDYDFSIKATYSQHKKKIHRISVSGIRLARI